MDLNEENLLEQQRTAFEAQAAAVPNDDGCATEGSEPFVGMEFESEEAAKLFYMAYASRLGFSVRISKSRRSRNDESIIMRRFVCSKEGFHTKKEAGAGDDEAGKKRRRRATIRGGCQAMIEVIQKYYGRWVVTKFSREHNHAVLPPSRVRYVAPEEYAHLEPFLGMEFSSHEEAQTFYYAYASRLGFDVRIRLSRRSTRDETFVMRRFVCTREGFAATAPAVASYEEGGHNAYEETSFRQRRRSQQLHPHQQREGCKAMFEVIRKEYDRWVVSKLILEHTHELAMAPSRVHYIQSQSEVVVLAKSTVNTNGGPGHQSHHHHHHHLHLPPVGDGGEQEALQPVLRSEDDGGETGSSGAVAAEETQNVLDYFKRVQEENPAFFYTFQLDKKGCLSCVFWADAKARMSYYCFGDAVTLDATLLDRNKNTREYGEEVSMLPLVTFMGVNHHLQSVLFGAALLLSGESEASYAWVFENWLLAMCGRPPASLVTEPGDAVGAAAARVFPGTCHRFNKWSILRHARTELSNAYTKHPALEARLEHCVLASETPEQFEAEWQAILDGYGIGESPWLQSVYRIRHHWVPVYTDRKAAFSGEASRRRRPGEGPIGFFGRYLSRRTSPLVMVSLFEQAVSCWYEQEALEDLANMYTKPVPRTPSLLLKQAAEVYTRAAFEAFQEEFMESLGYGVEKMDLEEEEECKFRVARDGEEEGGGCVVRYGGTEKRARCSCGRWEAAGMVCRHVLRVLPVVGVCGLPEDWVLKRWTKNAKNGLVLDESVRYNDICRDASKFAREGSSSVDAYKLAKEALQMAFAELIAAKKTIHPCPL